MWYTICAPNTLSTRSLVVFVVVFHLHQLLHIATGPFGTTAQHAFAMLGTQHRIQYLLHAFHAVREAHAITADLLPIGLAGLSAGILPDIDVVNLWRDGETNLFGGNLDRPGRLLLW